MVESTAITTVGQLRDWICAIPGDLPVKIYYEARCCGGQLTEGCFSVENGTFVIDCDAIQ